jgi:hypothetical protein
MEQNKPGKYLKYAIGEIVLVVVGILVALSINNWNTDRKNNNAAMYLLSSLKEDLANDVEELRFNIDDAINTVAMSIALQSYHRNPESFPIDVEKNARYLVSGVSFDINNITYNEMLNSGSINLLNPELRKVIAQHYWNIESFDGNRDYILQLKRTINQLLIQNGIAPFSINEEEFQALLNDPKLFAAIKQWEYLGNVQVQIHEEFLKNTQDLISHIENEIELNRK